MAHTKARALRLAKVHCSSMNWVIRQRINFRSFDLYAYQSDRQEQVFQEKQWSTFTLQLGFSFAKNPIQ